MRISEDGEPYKRYRNRIQNGDLLVWSNASGSLITRILLTIVRFFTMSEYSHVGIAYWDKNDRLYVYEASIPYVHFDYLSEKNSFYWVPMNIKWKDEYLKYMKKHLGKDYSIIDAIRGYLGKTDISNDKWQCAELCHDFYYSVGIDLGNNYTPSKLLKRVLSQLNTSVYYLEN